MKIKKCRSCGKEYEYETEDDLKEFFYKKKTHSGDYFLNTCKECEKTKYRKNYREGKYDAYKKRDLFYSDNIRGCIYGQNLRV